MKINILVKLTLIALVFTSSVSAQNYLLTIDITDPTTVVFSATGNFSSTDDNGHSAYDGIELLQFFNNSADRFGGSMTGTLTGGESGDPYDTFASDNFTVADGENDLNIYGDSTSDQQNFTTISAAFTGVSTADLSEATSLLPTPGTTGDIMTGFSLNAGSIIGQWIVISTVPTPEPSTLALAGLGAVTTILFARRRK